MWIIEEPGAPPTGWASHPRDFAFDVATGEPPVQLVSAFGAAFILPDEVCAFSNPLLVSMARCWGRYFCGWELWQLEPGRRLRDFWWGWVVKRMIHMYRTSYYSHTVATFRQQLRQN
jgi:hypothetical protein